MNYLTQRGKRIQLARILCFIFIPLIGVWGFTIFSLFDNVQSKSDTEGVGGFYLEYLTYMGTLKGQDISFLHPSLSECGSTLIGKNLLPVSNFFPLKVNSILGHLEKLSRKSFSFLSEKWQQT